MNGTSSKTLDITYKIDAFVTLPDVNFFDKKATEAFSKMQKEVLKIIFDLDILDKNGSNKSNNMNFITYCIDYFEMIKDYFEIYDNISEEIKNKLREVKNQDKVNIKMRITTNTRDLNY